MRGACGMRKGRRNLASVLALAALPSLAWAAPKPDEVEFRDKAGKEATRTGRVQGETPQGVQFQAGGVTLDIPARDLLALRHGDAPAEFLQAEEAAQQADYAAAADLYRKSLDAKGAGPWLQHDARFQRADSLYRLGNLAGAAEALEELRTQAPSGRFASLALVRLAQCRMFTGAFDQAKAALEALQGGSGSWEDAAKGLWKARILELQKDHEKARQAYGQVAAYAGQFPDMKDAALARAQACVTALGKPQEAADALQKLVEQASLEGAGGAVLRGALGGARLALAKAATDDKEKQRLASAALWDFLKVVVYGEAVAEEHAAAYAGAGQCFALLGDAARAQQMKEDRKRFYGDAFITPVAAP